MSHNAPHYTIPFCPHLGLQSCLCIPASTASSSSSPVCLPPPFQSSREAAPVLPSLFTLLFSSIYSALQRPGAWRSKQLLHYGERGSSDCAAPPHSSLSLSLTAHHGCASTPLIVTIKLGLPQCQSGFRECREPGQLSETFFENRKKPNSPSSAFD